MDPIICIDFGNSYTKVAFRNQPDVDYELDIFGKVPRTKRAQAHPVRDDGLTFDEDSVVIPTAVAFTRHGQNPRWYCGSQIEQISPDVRNDPSTHVFRNWKPRFFGTAAAAIYEPPAPMVTDDFHAEYRRWRHSYRASGSSPEYVLSFDQWRAVKGSFAGTGLNAAGDTAEAQYWAWEDRYVEENGDPHFLLGFKQWEAARKAFASLEPMPSTRLGPGAIALPIEDAEVDKIAVKFFSWLYGFVQDSVRSRGIDLQQTPARITLPGFGNIAGATERLINVLSLAGWKCNDVLPVLSEPVANAVGFFTRGLSVIWQPPHSVGWHKSYRKMLEHTALFSALRNHEQDTYRVLTIDIGGYTTDFAVTGFNTDPDADHLFPDPSQRSQNFDWTSEVGGVQDLDERLAGRLPVDKQTHFKNILNDTRQQRLEEFHRAVYGQLGRAFFQLPVPELRIAEDPDEQRMVSEVLDQFASHVCQWADNFVARCGSVDEVVLTGGGFSIPTIRDRVAQSLRKWSPRYIIAPHDERAGDDDSIAGYDSDQVDFAPALLNRCSTAFGGTSILFG